jgi:hypothetical protein
MITTPGIRKHFLPFKSMNYRSPGKEKSYIFLLGLIFTLIIGFLSGCNLLSDTPYPTAYPTEHLPTVVALTVQAMNSAVPSYIPVGIESTPTPNHIQTMASTPTLTKIPDETLTPSPSAALAEPSATIRTSTPTRTPTLTRTPSPTPSLPLANIQISRPGPASKVISPIRVNAYLTPGARGVVTIQLLGEDNRLLVRKVMSFAENSGTRVNISTELEFEIAAVAEAGRLVISTDDAHGRTIALASINLLLLSIGSNEINPPGDMLEPIVIREPSRNILIQGGVVQVSGMARFRSNDPILVEIFTADGKYAGPTRLINMPNPPDGNHIPFSVEAPYSVSSPTWVRVTVSEKDFNYSLILHATSVEVLLSP